MKFRNALLAATIVAAPGAALAQTGGGQPLFGMGFLPLSAREPVTGLYIGGGAGANWLMGNNLTAQGANARYFDGVPASRQGNIDFDTGFAGAVALGWGFGNGLRTEIEGNYRYNEVDKIGGFPGPRATSAFRNSGGDVSQYGVMANLYYDFQLPAFFPTMPIPFVPYVGGGVGYVWNDVDAVIGTRLPATGNTVRIDDTRGRFAFQGIAGAAFPITAVPGLALTVEYRYFGSLQGKYDGRVTNPAGQNVSTGRFEIDQLQNHSAMAGLRYAFNAPRVAAVAPVAPAVAPQGVARTYLVFFDWDRADLTDRARQIIGEAARNARAVGSTRIEVAGHADRSGSPQYNQRLSQRRAEAVAAELARAGIARNEMVIQAFGESRPLVPTADGVREPQNRRVEIVLR